MSAKAEATVRNATCVKPCIEPLLSNTIMFLIGKRCVLAADAEDDDELLDDNPLSGLEEAGRSRNTVKSWI